jgi:hypothetical protein
MVMKTILLLYISLLLSSFTFFESKQSLENISRKKAAYVTESTNLKNTLKDKPTLLFSINDKWYYLVVKNQGELYEYLAILDSKNQLEYLESCIIENPKDFLVNAFSKELYRKEFTDLNAEFYKDGYEISNGNPTYFYFKDKEGKLYGESKLTTIINPIPIDSKLYYHMLMKTLSLSNK